MEKLDKVLNELKEIKKDYEKDKLLLVTAFFSLLIIIIGVLLGNLSFTKELHDKYYIEENCSYYEN